MNNTTTYFQNTPSPERFRMELAGVSIELTPKVRKGMFWFCRNYITPEVEGTEYAYPDLSITTTDSDLKAEMDHATGCGKTGTSTPFEAEKKFVYRRIAEELPAHNALLMHAAAVTIDGKGYMFAGPSGAGKSTLAMSWEKEFKDRLRYINDDKPLLRTTNDGIYICGSPWCGKERRNNNLTAPLCGIAFIHQSKENRIIRMTKEEAWSVMPSQVYMCRERSKLKKTMMLIDMIIANTPIYNLESNASHDVVALSYDTLASSLMSKTEEDIS